MSRSISIFGLGYVGSVTAACLAHKGYSVIGVDLSPAKVELLKSGRSTIVEPRMSELVTACHQDCRLQATTDSAAAVMNSEISFLCVGTPSLRSGKLDLGHISPVCEEIGRTLARKDSFHLVVLRSTVLPGTAMTIIGAADSRHASLLRELYSWAPGRIFETSFTSAEMVKYVCNAWHALKVSFSNEVGALAKQVDVDAEAVMEIFAADTKLNISSSYLKPGFAFGGSCLPKDVRALIYRAKELDLKLPLFDAIISSNQEHLERAVEMVLHSGKKKIAILGLSFKAATDDLRESPQVQLVKRLLGEGRQIYIWDDNVSLGRLIGSNRQYIEEVIPHIGSLLCNDLAQVVREAEVVVI